MAAASVEFHTGVADPVGFACRLLRKAQRAGVRVLVTGPADVVAALDEALWTFEAQAFVPHVRLPGAPAAVAARTPVWLAADWPPGPLPPVWVNLGGDPPEAPDAFERVIEVVATDPEARAAARARWRHYEGWGVTPLHHGAG